MNDVAATFDAAAADYARQLRQGIALSGGSAGYFVECRVAWPERYLRHRAPQYEILRSVTVTNPSPTVLDFGCRVGNATLVLQRRLNAREVIGLDRSAEPLRVAKQRHASTVFWRTVAGADLAPDGIDIAYTSGVFQHIGPEMRQAKLTKIFSRLKPSGLLALFENNPWNPGSQWGISRIEFDRDAKCLYPMETQDRFLIAGFGNLQKRGMFYFSKMLGFIRLLGKILSLATLGAQYEVLA